MAVNLHGDLWVCMTELLGDVEDVRPIAEELRSEGVSQVVKSDRTKARLTEHFLECAVLYLMDVYRLPLLVCKHPLGRLVVSFSH